MTRTVCDNTKGAPIFSGLLILLCACICAAGEFDVRGGGGILVYLDDGAVLHGGMSASYQSNMDFYAGWDFWELYSNLPELSADITGVGLSAGIDLKYARPYLSFGTVKMSEMETREARGAVTTINGTDAFYIFGGAGVGAGDFEITPSAFFAHARSLSGDLYYFYGKPYIPAVWRVGLSAEHETTHRVGLSYYKLDFEIVNDNGHTLFRSDKNYSVGVDYGYAFPTLPPAFGIDMSLGVNYAYINIDGSLTAANQQYFLFPYAFYNMTAFCDASFGWLAGTFEYRQKHLTHKLICAAVGFFSGELYAGVHFKHRKFFGTKEGEEDMAEADMSITRGGIAMYALEGSLPIASANDKVSVGFELRKILGYSWKMDDIIKLEDTEDTAPKPPRSFAGKAKTVLLSGLSLDLKVGF